MCIGCLDGLLATIKWLCRGLPPRTQIPCVVMLLAWFMWTVYMLNYAFAAMAIQDFIQANDCWLLDYTIVQGTCEVEKCEEQPDGSEDCNDIDVDCFGPSFMVSVRLNADTPRMLGFTERTGDFLSQPDAIEYALDRMNFAQSPIGNGSIRALAHDINDQGAIRGAVAPSFSNRNDPVHEAAHRMLSQEPNAQFPPAHTSCWIDPFSGPYSRL